MLSQELLNLELLSLELLSLDMLFCVTLIREIITGCSQYCVHLSCLFTEALASTLTLFIYINVLLYFHTMVQPLL